MAAGADPKVLLLRWFAALWLVATATTVWHAQRRSSDLLRLPVALLFVAIAVMCWMASTWGPTREAQWPLPTFALTEGVIMTLPPGQRRIEGFPRFGTHLNRPAPDVPTNPVIEVGGVVVESFTLPVAELAALPRRELIADFHCVAGWSATNLRWEGVPFEAFYRQVVEPSVRRDTVITHVVFGGLDGFQSVVLIEDALAEDVLIADRLDGRPLEADHGAPVRLVSPSQYGYVSTKHLCRVDLHTSAPTRMPGTAHPLGRLLLRGPLIERHPRARVWREERHPYTPGRLLRPIYRLLIPPLRSLCARGSERRRTPPAAT